MDFLGPLPADYENVRALNRAFLEHLQQDGDRRCLGDCSQQIVSRLCRLTRLEIDRLSTIPFLLFSFRERDDRFWQHVLHDDQCGELFARPANTENDYFRLVSAGLGFVWQLAGRNPFAARLLCGASTHWCEQIAERTFFDLLAIAGRQPDLLCLRAQHDAGLWRKLLDTGLCREKETRSAAHIGALQYLLTCHGHPAIWQAAACASRSPALKVAEDPES